MESIDVHMLTDVILVRPIDPPSDSEIILFGTDEKVRYGHVVDVGPGRRHKKTGRVIPPHVQKGDTIIFGDHTGEDLTMNLNGENLLAMREQHVIGVLD